MKRKDKVKRFVKDFLNTTDLKCTNPMKIIRIRESIFREAADDYKIVRMAWILFFLFEAVSWLWNGYFEFHYRFAFLQLSFLMITVFMPSLIRNKRRLIWLRKIKTEILMTRITEREMIK